MRAQARPTGESSKPAACGGESQTASAAHRVRSASPGPKPVPVPVPSSLPNRTPGSARSRRGSHGHPGQRPGQRAAGGPPHVQRDQFSGAAAHATSAGGAGGDPQQLGVGGREDRLRYAPAAQISSYAASAVSTRVRSGCGCPSGATPPIGCPVCCRTNSGVARRAGDAEVGGQAGGVHPVRAGGEHEQRRAVRVEDERVGDLADLDAERLGRRGGGVHRVGQQPDLAGLAGAVAGVGVRRARSAPPARSGVTASAHLPNPPPVGRAPFAGWDACRRFAGAGPGYTAGRRGAGAGAGPAAASGPGGQPDARWCQGGLAGR